MNKRMFLVYLQFLILLVPLPFGGVGRVITPLVFMALLVMVLLATQQQPDKIMPPYWRWIRLFLILLFSFLFFQVIPLPWFLIRAISPGTTEVVHSLLPLGAASPNFQTISLVPAETWMQIARWMTWALFFTSLIRLQYSLDELRSIYHALLISGILQVGIAMIKYLGGNKQFFIFFYPVSNPINDRFLTGTIANPDHFAFFLELLFPIALGLFLAEFVHYHPGESWSRKILFLADENRRVLLYLVAGVVFGFSLILTGSRAGIISSVVSTIVFVQLSIFIHLPTSTRRKLRWVMAAVAILVVMVGFQETMSKFLTIGSAGDGRLVYWSNSLRLLKKFPLFGCGFGTFKFAYFLRDPLQGNWLTHAHNEYVETLAEGGLIGTLLFLSVGATVLTAIFRTWVSRRRPDIKSMSLGVMIAFLIAVLHLAFEFALRIPANTLVLILLAVIGLKTVQFSQGEPT